MATRTQAELIVETLGALGALPAGQTAEIEDVAAVSELLPSVRAMLASLEIAYIASFDTIPEEAFLPLAVACAWVCKTKFGTNGDDLQALSASWTEAAKNLKIIYRGKPTYKTLQTEFI